MQFTDSHIHLQDYKEKDAQQIIKEMKNLRFSKIICTSSHPSDWNKIAEIAINNPDFVYPAFGIHPWHIKEMLSNQQNLLIEYLEKFPNALIGECGLDNLRTNDVELQEQVFIKHIDLAKKYNRPLCIHSLKANHQIERLLKEMPPKFMFHAFSGSIQFLQKVLKFNAYISISSSILRLKNHIEIIKETPLDKLLSESDGPYMSSYEKIDDLITYIAKIKNIDKIALVKQIYCNFKEFCCV